MGEVDDFEFYADMTDHTDLLPTYGLRVMLGLDSDGEMAIVVHQVGTIEGITLLGVLEKLKHRLLEA